MWLLPDFSRLIISGLFAAGMAVPCSAMELEPRQWSHLPLATNFAGVGYAYTDADISVDPVLKLEDVELELHTWVGKYIRTFELFEKSVRIDFTQAYQEGDWTGLLDGEPASTS